MARDAYLTHDELELLTRVVKEVAPEEELLIQQLAARERFEFLKNRSGALGFGVHEVVDVVAPTIFVLGPWAWSVFLSEFESQTSDRMAKLVRRAFGRDKKIRLPPPPSKNLSEAEMQVLITDVAHQQCGLGVKKALQVGRVLAKELHAAQKDLGE